MSELREQLRSPRATHRAVRYPGDLAADVLGPATWADKARRLPQWFTAQWGWGALSGAAVAASVVVGAFFYRPAAAGGAAALRDPVDSLRVAVHGVGLWESDARPGAGGAGQRTGAASAGRDRFRIVPQPFRLDPPARPPLRTPAFGRTAVGRPLAPGLTAPAAQEPV